MTIDAQPRVLLLGSGEIGKEIAISLQRIGVETIALARYPGAPAQQITHHALTLDLLHTQELVMALRHAQPTHIIPETERFSGEAIQEANCAQKVFPALPILKTYLNKATLRRTAQYTWQLPTTDSFSYDSRHPMNWPDDWPFPCLLKAIYSASGKGQYRLHTKEDLTPALIHASETALIPHHHYLIESWLDFDIEITVIGIKQGKQRWLCPLIEQQHHEGRLSFARQPAQISPVAQQAIRTYAEIILDSHDHDIFLSMEFFVRGDNVWFSELAPRPHDSGFLTLYSQNISQFDLYVRSLLGLPIPEQITLIQPYAAFPLYNSPHEYKQSHDIMTHSTHYHLFGKPTRYPSRRMAYVFHAGNYSRDACRSQARIYHHPDTDRDSSATHAGHSAMPSGG